MARSAVVAFSLFLASCLGPILPLTPAPKLGHEWLCVVRVCPFAAQDEGGVLVGAKYDRSNHRCICAINDSRRLSVIRYPDPHDPNNR